MLLGIIDGDPPAMVPCTRRGIPDFAAETLTETCRLGA